MAGTENRDVRRVLRFSMVATTLYVLATFVFGLRTHSLALLSESGHNLSDLLAIGLSSFALYMQSRPATDDKTFGYQRAGVLAAFINASTLIVLSVWIAVAAILRFGSPVPVQPRPMMIVACAGVVMNGAIAALLYRFSGEVNVRSVFVHMLGDTLSTAAVILGGAAILFTGAAWIDPVLSLLIAGVIVWSSVGIIRETLNILLEGTPSSIQLPRVREAIRAVHGVVDIHDLHVWSLGHNTVALASHIAVEEMSISDCTAVRDIINASLLKQFRIRHTTLQFEAVGCMARNHCDHSSFAEDPHDHSHDHHGHSHSHGLFGHSH